MQTVSLDPNPDSQQPCWPPPALECLEISAYAPPMLHDLPLQTGLTALAASIPALTW